MTAHPDEIADRLYGLPLAEFIAARDAAARELRKAGERGAAEEVGRLRKPTTAAAAVNRLVRDHRDRVEEFLRVAAVLRDAQFSGKGDLAATTRAEHEALERLLTVGGEATRQSLLAAAVDDDAAQQLLEARLVRELEPRGFGTLLAHAAPSGRRLAPPPRRTSPSRPTAKTGPATEAWRATERPAVEVAPGCGTAAHAPPDDGTPGHARPEARPALADADARAALDGAQAALNAAEAAERRARRRWEDCRADLEEARAAVERARRGLRERSAGAGETG